MTDLELPDALVKVTFNGKITIPVEIRERANIEMGDVLRISIKEIVKQPEGDD